MICIAEQHHMPEQHGSVAPSSVPSPAARADFGTAQHAPRLATHMCLQLLWANFKAAPAPHSCMSHNAHLAREKQPHEALRQRLAALFCRRQLLLQQHKHH